MLLRHLNTSAQQWVKNTAHFLVMLEAPMGGVQQWAF